MWRMWSLCGNELGEERRNYLLLMKWVEGYPAPTFFCESDKQRT